MANEQDFIDSYLDFGEAEEEVTKAVTPEDLQFEDILKEPTTKDTPSKETDHIDDKPESQETPQETPTDVLTELLKQKGIVDPTKIKVEDEDGKEELVDFKELSVEEQLEILRNEIPEREADDLDDEEINLINYLRENQVTFDDLVGYIKTQAVQEYLANAEPEAKIEEMTDDEVFLTDLLSRVKDMTDEEATQALELEKQNEALYAKKIQALRANMIEQERLKEEEATAIAEEQRKQSFEQFQQALIDAAPNVQDIGGRITLDNSDIEEVVDFLVSEDATGQRFIAKALNDPEALMKMTWFYLKGEDAIEQIASYYESEIKAQNKANYEKGYEDGQKGVRTSSGKVVRKEQKAVKQPIQYGFPTNPGLKETKDKENK